MGGDECRADAAASRGRVVQRVNWRENICTHLLCPRVIRIPRQQGLHDVEWRGGVVVVEVESEGRRRAKRALMR